MRAAGPSAAPIRAEPSSGGRSPGSGDEDIHAGIDPGGRGVSRCIDRCGRRGALRGRLAALAVLACLIAAPAAALDPQRRLDQLHQTAWTVKDGAPGQIGALAQTGEGYLWLGTQGGLFRFDGVRFERFEPAPSQAFPSTSVSSLFAPPGGGLWVGFRYGGASFVRDGRVAPYAEAEGFPTGTVFGFAADRDGAVWAATFRGLVRFDGTRWERIGTAWDYPEQRTRTVFADRDGAVWAVTDEAAYALPAGQRRFVRQPWPGAAVNQIAQAADGRLWALEAGGRVRPLAPGGPGGIALDAAGLLFDRDGGLWIAGEGDGLWRVPHPGQLPDGVPVGRGDRRLENHSERQGLSADYVGPLLEDREGNLWVGTSRGLDRFRASRLVPAGFPSGSYDFALAAGAGGAIWAGTKNRPLMRLDGAVTPFPGVDRISCAYRDADGTLWFGGSSGLWRVGERGPVAVAALPPEASGSGVQAITRDRSGALWVSLNVPGVFRWHDGQWTRFASEPELLGRASPLIMMNDAEGRRWMGFSRNRIVLADAAGPRVLSSWEGLDVGNVTALLQARERVWVGGERGLAHVLDGRFVRLRAAHGEPFTGISGLVETAAGDLWLNGSRGVVAIDAGEIARALADPSHPVDYRLFDFLDGLPGLPDQFRPLPSAVAGDDGRLWFATASGVVWVDPARIARNAQPPPVLIESLQADGRPYPVAGEPLLPVRAGTVQIRYTAPSLSIPERVQFRYRLHGVDAQWQAAGTRREAFYTQLGPGRYRFEVIAANEDAVWSPQPATIAFVVPPAFVQTPGFVVLCVAAGLGLLWIVYLLRLERMADRLRLRLHERHRERERIARELHDTLLQSIQGLILRFQAALDRMPALDAQRETLEAVLDRAEQALAEGRDRVLDLRADGDAVDLAQALARVGAQWAGGPVPAFGVVSEGALRPLAPLAREEAYWIGREAILNAFRHAAAQRIEVEIAYEPGGLRLRLRDDGRGIDAPLLQAGGRPGHWGLRGMHERAERIGARLAIWTRAGSGTEIELWIPGAAAWPAQD